LINRKVTVIDYGVGNILSVTRALQQFGADVSIASSNSEIRKSTRVVLPGVGAFPNAMKSLSRLNIVDTIVEMSGSGTPILGICLGMQLLFEESYEQNPTTGLSLIPGYVERVQKDHDLEMLIKVPHIGWSEINRPTEGKEWRNTILQSVEEGSFAYFVHSYGCHPRERVDVLAVTQYCDLEIIAAVQRENVIGCQFHPEKSGENGLKILESFMKL
jgi:glutamine amidotransferase